MYLSGPHKLMETARIRICGERYINPLRPSVMEVMPYHWRHKLFYVFYYILEVKYPINLCWFCQVMLLNGDLLVLIGSIVYTFLLTMIKRLIWDETTFLDLSINESYSCLRIHKYMKSFRFCFCILKCNTCITEQSFRSSVLNINHLCKKPNSFRQSVSHDQPLLFKFAISYKTIFSH